MRLLLGDIRIVVSAATAAGSILWEDKSPADAKEWLGNLGVDEVSLFDASNRIIDLLEEIKTQWEKENGTEVI